MIRINCQLSKWLRTRLNIYIETPFSICDIIVYVFIFIISSVLYWCQHASM